MGRNINLHNARSKKDDEFYTYLEDIEKELFNYKDYFKGKTILLNCDDPEWSNFFKYFKMYFKFFKIKKVIATHYKGGEDDKAYALELTEYGKKEKRTDLKGDGDFRSTEVINYLKEADIVVTNPPFSLFGEYITQLIDFNKKFIVVGPITKITAKTLWPYIVENKVWLGINKIKQFKRPDGTAKKFGNIGWFTNLENQRRNREIDLYGRRIKDNMVKYDNYNALNVDEINHIPDNYYKPLGVPITFLDHHNPKQFKIISLFKGGKNIPYNVGVDPLIDGECKFPRIIIQRIRGEENENK